MSHSTNRIAMLMKALRKARPDFTEHNASKFAKAVIDAPDDVYAAKPLTYLPQAGAASGGSGLSHRADSPSHDGEDASAMISVVTIEASLTELAVVEASAPGDRTVGAPAATGDIVRTSDGAIGEHLGEGRVRIVNGAAGEALQDAYERGDRQGLREHLHDVLAVFGSAAS